MMQPTKQHKCYDDYDENLRRHTSVSEIAHFHSLTCYVVCNRTCERFQTQGLITWFRFLWGYKLTLLGAAKYVVCGHAN